MSNIKMIWDFYGPDADEFAKHHVVHLKQFMLKEGLEALDIDIESPGEEHSFAYMTVKPELKLIIRDSLRPKRAVLA